MNTRQHIPNQSSAGRIIEPSIRNALPHYLPLGIFPLLLLAALYGGWWLLPAFLFMSVSGPLDRALGPDGRTMDPAKTPERRLLWHNLPVWTWAILWPPLLVFGMWQILVAERFALWEAVILAILLTMEAQAVFVVGHELVHRRSTWERRLGEFLLACASYPQYATEHVYIHHAKVGTPYDAGSAPKGESFWRYFPKEVASNLVNSWQVAGERLARHRLPRWHYSNPFWRYGLFVAFWYGLTFWMGGAWAVVVYALLGFGCVFSMKISNYFQHYGLRRVRLPSGRWEKVLPRHSWSADWKFSNWMFFNMQRHADHHAMASRHYPLLQIHDPDESPHLPGTYADIMNLVVRPKRWFAKMDPLVDQWRRHFYPQIEDWSAYDSRVAALRPDAFEAIVEIFAAAPRLAKRIERNPELLDALQDREFTDLDLPKGFGPDPHSERIARRGLTRLYWTREMGVREMRERIDELPMTDAKDAADAVRHFSNDKAFQIGMHLVRGNLSPAEARLALSTLAHAAVAAVLEAVVADCVDRVGTLGAGGVAAIFLGDLASREAYPGVPVCMFFIHDGLQIAENARLCRRFQEGLVNVSRDSLLFSPLLADSETCLALPLDDLAQHCGHVAPFGIPALTRARCIFECGDSELGRRFDAVRRQVLAKLSASDTVAAQLRQRPAARAADGVSAYAEMRGGLADVERAARCLQLDEAVEDPAPTAAELFHDAEPLAQAATLWRDLQSILHLIGEPGFDPADAGKAGKTVQALVASACGYADFETLHGAVIETARRADAEIDALAQRAHRE